MTQAAIIFCVILMMTALEEFTGLVSSETVHDVRIWSIGGPYLSNFAAVVVTCFVVLFSLFTYRHKNFPGKRWERAAGLPGSTRAPRLEPLG
ncbi:hypothetical protein CDEF62S_05376 [Castellaniella defragrans]